jgi:hypothetical protein
VLFNSQEEKMTRKNFTLHILVTLGLVLSLIGSTMAVPAQAAPMRASVITFTGEELLGKPTDDSITINIVPASTIEYHYQYGTSPGVYTGQTSNVTATGGQPHEVVITGLTANTQYYYRMRYHAPGDAMDDWVERDEHTFHTQRAPGSTFKFTIVADSHAYYNTEYHNTMENVRDDEPDFHFDLGDTFMTDNDTSQSVVNTEYLAQRGGDYMDLVGHSSPIFLASGNHENEEGWNFDDTPFSIALASVKARKLYYPTPITDGFYSGNDDLLTDLDPATYGDQYRENYYAWTWGDALFVVFDPYHYTMVNPYGASAGEGSDDPASGDGWNWTLGETQYNWFKNVLETSDAKYKFVFAHHVVGGMPSYLYVRGGAEAVPYYEWGGDNWSGTWEFDTERSGWDTPIHQLMVENGVSAFFHGHDHQYAYEVRDDIVYQCLPRPTTGMDFNYYSESDPYTIKVLSSPGHLRVTVSPTEATVEYIRTSSGTSNYTYTIEPNQASTDPTITITGVPLAEFSSEPGTPSAEQSYTVSGSNLTDDITITAPTDFEISTTSGSGFGSPLTLTQSDGSVAATDIYVRFNRADEGTSSDDIAHTSSGATQQDVAVSGTASTAIPGEVTVDGAVSSGTDDGVSSISFAHTTGSGENRLLLVGVSWNSGSNERDITSVIFNDGTTDYPLSEVFNQQASANPRNAAIYSLLNPPSGEAGTVTVTFDDAVSNGIVAGAVNFAGVDQTTPLGTAAGADGSSSDAPTVTLTGLNGDELVFDTVFQGGSDDSQTLTPGADQTEQWTGFAGNTRGSASTEEATGSEVTMSWTAASSSIWAIAAVPINPAPAGTTYELTMASDGNGTTDPAIGVHTYAENTVVSLSATPNSGYVFDSWTGDADCADGSVTMDADKSCTATFVGAPPVGEVTVDGAVSSETDDGVSSISVSHTTGTGTNRLMVVGVSANSYNNARSIESVTFNYDTTELPLTQVGEVENEAGRLAAIYGLVNPPSGQAGTVEVTFSDTVNYGIVAGVANFAGVNQSDPFDDFVSAVGTEATAINVDVPADLNDLVFDTMFLGAATLPSLTADASQTELWNATVDRVRGVASTEQATTTPTPMSWTASGGSTSYYWAIGAVPINPAAAGPTHDLTIAVSPSEGGTTDPAVGVHTYVEGAVVDITATPATGYEFDHWSGDCTGTGACQVTMDADKAVTAHFDLLPPLYTLTMAVDPSGGGTTTPAVGDHTYEEDELVAISATPAVGYEFDHWSGDVANPNEPSTTVTMDGDKTVTAHFVPESGILGDVNGDEVVNSTDALVILSCDVGIDTSGFCPMNCGDVNADELVNSTDALIILSYDVGMTVPYPVGQPGCPASVTPCPGCAP